MKPASPHQQQDTAFSGVIRALWKWAWLLVVYFVILILGVIVIEYRDWRKKDVATSNQNNHSVLRDNSSGPAVTIRLNNAIPKGFFEPNAMVVIAPLNPIDKVQGIVLSTTGREESSSPANASKEKTAAAAASPKHAVFPRETPISPKN